MIEVIMWRYNKIFDTEIIIIKKPTRHPKCVTSPKPEQPGTAYDLHCSNITCPKPVKVKKIDTGIIQSII